MKSYVKFFFIISFAIASNNVTAMQPGPFGRLVPSAVALPVPVPVPVPQQQEQSEQREQIIIRSNQVSEYFTDIADDRMQCKICDKILSKRSTGAQHLTLHRIFVNQLKPSNSKLAKLLEQLGYVKILNKSEWICLLCKNKLKNFSRSAKGHMISVHGIGINRSFYKKLSDDELQQVPKKKNLKRRMQFSDYLNLGHLKVVRAFPRKAGCVYCANLIKRNIMRRHLLQYHNVDISKPINAQDFVSLRHVRNIHLRFPMPIEIIAFVFPITPSAPPAAVAPQAQAAAPMIQQRAVRRGLTGRKRKEDNMANLRRITIANLLNPVEPKCKERPAKRRKR